MSTRSFSTRGWVFLALVACFVLTWGGRSALAIRILMVGGGAGPTNNGDVGTFLLLSDTFGTAVNLGDDGVFYMQGSASNPADAEEVDVVFISLWIGSYRMKKPPPLPVWLSTKPKPFRSHLKCSLSMVIDSRSLNAKEIRLL